MASRASPSPASAPPTSSAIRWSPASCAPMTPTMAPAGPMLLGDVVVARETMAAEAAGQGKALADHFVHLTVHGVLHLLGYDHEKASDAEMMEGLEIVVLAGLGVGDPYRSGPYRSGPHGSKRGRR